MLMMCLSLFQVDNMHYIIEITTPTHLIDEETEEISMLPSVTKQNDRARIWTCQSEPRVSSLNHNAIPPHIIYIVLNSYNFILKSYELSLRLLHVYGQFQKCWIDSFHHCCLVSLVFFKEKGLLTSILYHSQKSCLQKCILIDT